MSRAKHITDAVVKTLDEHFRTLNDEKQRLRSVRVVVRMDENGEEPKQTNVNIEFEKKCG